MATLTIKKLAKFSFVAAVKFQGQWISGTGKHRKSAIKAVEDALTAIGATLPPSWEISEVVPVVTPAIKPVVASVPAIIQALPPVAQPVIVPPPALELDTGRTAPLSEIPPEDSGFDLDGFPNVEEDELPEGEDLPEMVIPELPGVPGCDNGIITPWSDRAAWVKIANSAISQMMVSGIQNNKEANTVFRIGVNALMKAHNALGAYVQVPQGPHSSHVVSLVQEVIDPTIRRAVVGEGDRRELGRKIQKNEMPERPAKAGRLPKEEYLALKAAGQLPWQLKAAGKPVVAGKAPAGEPKMAPEAKEASGNVWKLANEASKSAGDAATAAGKSMPEIMSAKRLAYKWTMVVASLQGNIPCKNLVKFTADLAAAGVNQAQIDAAVSRKAA
jgi:hypothetical protein